MALIGRGTKCPLCGEDVLSAPYIATSHFIANKRDRYYRMSDAGFHVHCVRGDPGAARIVEMYQRHKESRGRPAMCVVCGEAGRLGDAKEWLTTGYVDADPESELYRFNFVDIHEEHLQDWDLLAVYMRGVERRILAGTWDRDPWYPRGAAPRLKTARS